MEHFQSRGLLWTNSNADFFAPKGVLYLSCPHVWHIPPETPYIYELCKHKILFDKDVKNLNNYLKLNKYFVRKTNQAYGL